MWKIGHRGACGHAPENTLSSVRKALELGVHGIEFDIQLSKDGEPVVIHDDTVDRTTNGSGLVSGYSFKELQCLSIIGGERISSLRQLLDMVDKRCRLFIELKTDTATKPVAELLRHYVSHFGWSYEQFFICSFNHPQLVAIRQLNPQFRTCALLEGIPVSLAAIAEDAGAWAINPYIGCINQLLVDDAHRRHLKVITWTANQPLQIAKAVSLGVDGVISDYPERL